MKKLVLGGEGFVGSHLVDSLTNCTPLDNRSNNKHVFHDTVVADITGVSADLIAAIEDCDVVIHAACSDIRKSMVEPMIDCSVNVLGTLNILTLCRLMKKKMLYISSVSVHSESSHYAISKRSAEMYCDLYHKMGWVDTCIVRLSNVYGNRDTESVISKWLTEEKITLIDPDATRDFVYIDDAVRGISTMLGEWPSQPIDIGTGVETSLGTLAHMIADRRKIPVIMGTAREIDNVKRRVVDWIPASRLGFTAEYTISKGLEAMGV